MTSKDEAIRTRNAIRCAKAAMLLYSLSSSRNPAMIVADGEEKTVMQRELADLRRRLAREKVRRERIKLCGLMELLLVVVLVLLLSIFFVVLFLVSY